MDSGYVFTRLVNPTQLWLGQQSQQDVYDNYKQFIEARADPYEPFLLLKTVS